MYKIACIFLLLLVGSQTMAQYNYDPYIDQLMKAEEEDFLAEIPGLREDRLLIRHIKVIGQIIEDYKISITFCLNILRTSRLIRVESGSEKIIIEDFVTASDEYLNSILLDSSMTLKEASLLEAKKKLTVEDSFLIIALGENILDLEESINKLAKNVHELLEFHEKGLNQLSITRY